MLKTIVSYSIAFAAGLAVVLVLTGGIPHLHLPVLHLSLPRWGATRPVNGRHRRKEEDADDYEAEPVTDKDGQTVVPNTLEVIQLTDQGQIYKKHKLPLPLYEHDYAVILPPHNARPSADAFSWVKLSDSPHTNTISHLDPLLVYKGSSGAFYVHINPRNTNRSTVNWVQTDANGKQVLTKKYIDHDIALETLLNNGKPQVLYLADEPLAFRLIPPKERFGGLGTVDLNHVQENPLPQDGKKNKSHPHTFDF